MEVELKLVADNKDAVKGVRELAQESQKLYDNNKKAQQREVGLIADIEKELDRLKEKKRNAFTIESIEKYNKKIAEAEHDLKEYNKTGIETEKQNTKITTSLKELATKLIAGVAVWKTFKAVIESTESTALSFHSTVNGLKTGLDKLMKTLVSGEWNEFFKMFRGGFYDAVKAGKEFTKEMDRINNIQRQYALQTEDLNKTIEEQRRIFYEDDKTSLEEKIKASDKMLGAMKDKAQLEIKIAEETYQAISDITVGKNKLTEKELKEILNNYENIDRIGKNNEVLTDQISKMEKALKKGIGYVSGALDAKKFEKGIYEINNLFDTVVTQENIDKLKELQNNLGPDAARFTELIQGYDMLTEAEKKTLGQAMLRVAEANNQYLTESKRVFKMRENMEDKAIQEQIAAQIEFNNQYNAINKKKREEKEKQGVAEIERLTKEYKEKNALSEKDFEDSVAWEKLKDAALTEEARVLWEAMQENQKRMDALDEYSTEQRKANLEKYVQSARQFIEVLDWIAERQLDEAERSREILDTKISETQRSIETEAALQKEGYSNNLMLRQRELTELQKQRDIAFTNEENARKKQRQIQIATMMADKASSVADIIINTKVANAKALALSPLTGGMPWVAYNNIASAISIAAIIAAVATATTAKFAKGGWTGNGSDRDETGERVAGIVHEREYVIRRGPASKFRPILDAINKDDHRLILQSFNKIMPIGSSVNNVIVQNEGPNKRLDEVNNNLKRLNNKEEIISLGNKTIIRRGKNTRVIKK